MRTTLSILALSMLASTAAGEEPVWRNLPLIEDGRVARHWQHVGFGKMRVDGESVVTDADGQGLGLLVYTPEKFGNCQIRIVYRPKDLRANSGVFVRIDDDIQSRIGQDAGAVEREADGSLSPEMLAKMQQAADDERGAWYAVHRGYEVQLCDTGDPLHRTGAIYSLAPSAYEPPDEVGGHWRTMIITLAGDVVRVEQDGNLLTEFQPNSEQVPPRQEWYEPKRDAERPQSGYIGLQTHDPGDVVWFREVSVRALPEGQ
jgi:hypothetical protein